MLRAALQHSPGKSPGRSRAAAPQVCPSPGRLQWELEEGQGPSDDQKPERSLEWGFPWPGKSCRCPAAAAPAPQRPTGHPPSVTGAGPLRVRARAAARISGGAAGLAALAASSTLGSAAAPGRRRKKTAPSLSAAAIAAAPGPPVATARLLGSAEHHGKGVFLPEASRETRVSAAARHDGKEVVHPGAMLGGEGRSVPGEAALRPCLAIISRHPRPPSVQGDLG